MHNTTLTAALLALSVAAQAQTCNPAIPRKAPDSRYTVQAGGVEVLDTQTGLVWQRCSLGQSWNGSTCAGSAGVYTWQSALQAARDLGNGWRVPNFKELQSLVEEACYSPAINETLFPATATGTYYWTSSPVAGDGSSAWIVYFGYGSTSYGGKYNSYYVRVVRSGQ